MKFKVHWTENGQADRTLNDLKVHGLHKPWIYFSNSSLIQYVCTPSVSEHFTLYTLDCLADAVDKDDGTK